MLFGLFLKMLNYVGDNFMNYTVCFLIRVFIFIAIQSCYTMENENPLKIRDIISVQHPTYAYYLDKSKIVISHGNGCSIVDSKIGKEINKISDVSCSNVAVARNKIFFSYGKIIKIYDTEKNMVEWSNTEIYDIFSIDCNSQYLFLCMSDYNLNRGIMAQYDYVTGDYNKVCIECPMCPNFAVDRKQIMCMVQGTNLLKYNASDLLMEPTIIEMPFKGFCCKIGFNGIASVRNFPGNTISLIDLQNDSNKPSCIILENEHIFNALFYPRGSVLATISRPINAHQSENQNQIISYWDVITQKLISSIALFNRGDVWNFSFSPDGNEVIITFDDRCTNYSVPFEVRYEPDTKVKFPYLLFVLNSWIEQHQDQPKDITQLLTHRCLELFRRQAYEI